MSATIAAACSITRGSGRSAPAPAPVVAQIVGPYVTAPSETALPPVVNPIPVPTPVIFFAWAHPSVPANEHITITLIARNVGAVAPPNTTVTTTMVTAPQAGANHGTSRFSAPTAGWPPGQYRVTATGESVGPFSQLDFAIQ